MTSNSRDNRRELRDWSIITLIILMGFLCLIAAGSMAIRFPPSWKLSANMDSLLDPNSDFLTRRPQGFIEPVDQSILTPPIWLGFFQTPGVTVLPPTPLPTSTQAAIATATVPPVATLNPTRTATPTSTIVYIPASPTNTSLPAPSTATNIPPGFVDLQITKDDGVLMYSAGSVLTYTITVINNGPANVTGAIITDEFLLNQFDTWEWICTAQLGGAKGCNAAASNRTNFSDTVTLPNGASIVYTVSAQVLLGASGDLVNTAEVAAPSPPYIESDPSNNTAIDIDQFLPTSPLPIGNIGDTQDGFTDVVAPGNSVAIRFSTPLAVNGHAGYDLVYYELANGAGIQMDLVALEIGNGTNWYTVFYWGDNIADSNSTMNFTVLGETATDNPETDNRDFSSPPPGLLYNGTGIAIELDGIVPPGNYSYFRIISPATPAYPAVDDLDGCEVDAIAILP